VFNTMKSQEKIHKSELSGHRFGPQAQNRGMAPAEARPLTKPMSNRAARVSAWHLGRPPGQAPSPSQPSSGRSPASLPVSPVPFVRQSAGWVNGPGSRFHWQMPPADRTTARGAGLCGWTVLSRISDSADSEGAVTRPDLRARLSDA
jgi:hypothetical protein